MLTAVRVQLWVHKCLFYYHLNFSVFKMFQIKIISSKNKIKF